jgi:hypothetical protein
MPPDKLEGIVHIIEEAEAISLSSESNDNVKEEDDTQQESLEPLVDEEEEEEEVEEEEGDDESALCSLMKGTALRELGQLDAASSCLQPVREQTCYVEKELFVIPMAAYERALLLIMQHTEVATRESTGTSNFEFLLEVWRL